jgi:predicted transcriptional regulator
MAEATFTFRVDESLKQEFSSFAKEIDRSGTIITRFHARFRQKTTRSCIL